MTRLLLAVLLAMTCIGCNAEREQPAPIADKQPSVSISRSDRTVLVFEEPVTPDAWIALKDQLPLVERLEFLADDQPALDWSLLDDAQELERFRCDGVVGVDLAQALSSHPGLRILNVQETSWDDATAEFVGDLSELTLLRIGGAELTDDSIERFASSLTKLAHLHLIGVGMTDRSLPAIAANETIESLYLDGVDVSEDALSTLIKERPDIHLHINQLHLKSDPRQD